MNSTISIRDTFFCYLLFSSVPLFSGFGIPAYKSIVSSLFIIVFFIYYCESKKFRIISKYPPCLLWLLLNIYHYTNGMVKNVPGVDYVDFLHGMKTYACMCICCYLGCKNFSSLIKMLTNVFILKALLIVIVVFFTKGIHGRLTGGGYSATGVGQSAALCCVLYAYAFLLGIYNVRKLMFMYIIPFVIVMLSQSRNSLAILSLTIVSIYLLTIIRDGKGVKFKSALVLVVGIVIIFIGMELFEQSEFGQRVKQVTENYEEGDVLDNYGTGTFFDKIVGDRLIYYVKGWDLFVKNPIFGIGIWNYREITGGTYPLHSEYMIHLCEGGIVAVFIWILFHVNVFKSLFYSPIEKNLKFIAFSSLFEILFCGIYTREFFSEQFYCFYGIIFSLTIYFVPQSQSNKYDKCL